METVCQVPGAAGRGSRKTGLASIRNRVVGLAIVRARRLRGCREVVFEQPIDLYTPRLGLSGMD